MLWQHYYIILYYLFYCIQLGRTPLEEAVLQSRHTTVEYFIKKCGMDVSQFDVVCNIDCVCVFVCVCVCACVCVFVCVRVCVCVCVHRSNSGWGCNDMIRLYNGLF